MFRFAYKRFTPHRRVGMGGLLGIIITKGMFLTNLVDRVQKDL
jgi:hypothetical protein